MTHCVHCDALNPDDAVLCGACGNQPTLAPGPDRTGPFPAAVAGRTGPVAGRYEVLGILGRGGMGTVYRVRDSELGEDVALKMLPGGADPVEVARLKREIITARRITHPNVIRLHDFGVADGEGYLSMELLPGGTLAERLRAPARMSFDAAMRVALGVSEGLAAAHRAGIVHRDLKPQNVLFDASGTPKLVDFGLARATDASTRTVGFSGTPHYMNPEMADGREITARSDVYSLGVVLFELFTGELPFKADTLVRLVMLHTQTAPPRPRDLRPDLPESLENLILRCLEKDPANRYADAGAVAADLERIARGESVAAGPRAPATAAVEAARASSATKSGSRSRRAFAAGGVVIAIAAVLWIVGGGHVSLSVSGPKRGASIAATSVPIGATSPGAAATAEAAATARADATATTSVSTVVVTPAPRPSATPVHVARVHPVPTPNRVLSGTGRLTVFAKPWAEVWIDGRRIAESTPLKDHSVPAGAHTVRIVNPARHFSAERKITFRDGVGMLVRADVRAGTVEVERAGR